MCHRFCGYDEHRDVCRGQIGIWRLLKQSIEYLGLRYGALVGSSCSRHSQHLHRPLTPLVPRLLRGAIRGAGGRCPPRTGMICLRCKRGGCTRDSSQSTGIHVSGTPDTPRTRTGTSAGWPSSLHSGGATRKPARAGSRLSW
jgi:hypothetical protein